jgi:uncharacterized DUF497 family protein
MEFEWDEAKAETNRRKHGISFDAAKEVFSDLSRFTRFDDRFDYGETREITVGRVQGRLLSVVHTERQGAVRIISAREADPEEIRTYYQGHARSE